MATKKKVPKRPIINVSCHRCGISKKKIRQDRIVSYIDCMCNKTYCMDCLDLDINFCPNASGCLWCKQECCCNYEICPRLHKHCYVYNKNPGKNKLLVKNSYVLDKPQFICSYGPSFDKFDSPYSNEDDIDFIFHNYIQDK